MRPRRRSARSGPAIRIRDVRLSSPEKVLWPAQGTTKRELAEYYEAVEDWILPFLRDRPLTLLRCPSGRRKECFYQKHAADSIPDVVGRVEISKGEKPYMYVESLESVLALVQLGTLELHVWNGRVDRLDRPDQLVFDLDPGAGAGWEAVVAAARSVRDVLEEVGLPCYVKTSGGKGVHVMVPLERRSSWDESKGFARSVAQRLTRREPERYVATMSKEKRRGKIFIDYLRNGAEATAVVAYSPRARSGAPVSVPIRWEELTAELDPGDFTVESVPRLLASRTDPWKDFYSSRARLTKSMRSAMEQD